MNTNKWLIAGIVGGVVSFIAGFIIWGLALDAFAQANMGSATGIRKEEMGDMWAVVVGALASGFLVALIFSWANIKTPAAGAKTGAIIGLLLGININFIMFGTTNVTTLPLAVVDTLAYGVLYVAIGAVVGWMLGRGVPALQEAPA